MTGSRLDHLNIVVSDLDAAAAFFRLLGFVEEDRAELGGAWLSAVVGLPAVRAEYIALRLPGSATRLELIAYRHPPSPLSAGIADANRIGFRHLALAVDDIAAEVARLQAAGVEFLSEIQTFPASGKKLVYFPGPDGILLELAEYPRKPCNPEDPRT